LALAVILLIPLGINLQTDPNIQGYIKGTQERYLPKSDALLLSADERDVIEHLHDYVPTGETVIVQPWTGSAVTYALTGYKVTAAHPLYTATPDAREIYQQPQ
jgi:hypothetical protein